MPDGVDMLVAAFSYGGMGGRLVLALKAGGRRDLVPLIVAAMAVHLPVELGSDPPSLVTWAPTTARRRRARGFDQAHLLARGLGARQGWPARRALVRTSTASQVGHDRAARVVGPGFRPCRGLWGSVLVVDDVVTTGATMAAAAGALRQGGARRVIAVVAALTERRG